jgi:hypothetical protein
MGLASTGRNGRHNAHSDAHISGLIPKCSLNLLSLVFKERTPVVGIAATNVAANVQKRAGSTGNGIVVAAAPCTGSALWVRRRYFIFTLGTVVQRSYVGAKKLKTFFYIKNVFLVQLYREAT